MKIFNSCDEKKHELVDKKITIYNCGPTVYNHIHLGNLRPLIIFDVLHRFLEFLGKEVYYVHNITDIDDKIINAAKALKTNEKALTTKYFNAYKALFKLLNIKEMVMPKVSDYIGEIIKYIQKLIDKKNAYETNGDVYFDVKKISNYGHISHKNVNELITDWRKKNKNNKKNPLDFNLWKKTDLGKKWTSPWSKGRPGWHTECCVLINKLIGDHVTIHGGGVDLKFPHHENENAQNFALLNRDIADYWMHIGHVNINGSKMSKSLNNFILVKDIANKDNSNGIRWFFYKTKYQHPINFTKEILNDSINEINKIIKTLITTKTYLISWKAYKLKNNIYNPKFIASLNDDLNLPNAITEISLQIKEINTYLRSQQSELANKVFNEVNNELKILGIKYNQTNHYKNLSLIKQWKTALEKKNYLLADELKKQLIKKQLL